MRAGSDNRRDRPPAAVAGAREHSEIRGRRDAVGLRRVLDRRRLRDRLAGTGSRAVGFRGNLSRCRAGRLRAGPQPCPGGNTMNLLKEVAAELVGMFFGDTRMTLTVLIVVAASGALVTFIGIVPLVGEGSRGL